MAIAELLRAFGQAYDDDYDKNRLLQRWEGQTKQDYNLSSDDESDEEPHEVGLSAYIYSLAGLNLPHEIDRNSGLSYAEKHSGEDLLFL
jgi:hypothetical protein